MVNAFQCICGANIQVAFGIPRVICPICGTCWQPNSVKLVNGTTYDIQENGRWVVRSVEKPELSWVPTSLIFGEL